jgi:Na+/proline symporter
MGEFLGSTSVAEAMGNLYGKEVRLITAVCGILGTIGGIAVQFKVFGNVFNYFLGIDSTYAIFFSFNDSNIIFHFWWY